MARFPAFFPAPGKKALFCLPSIPRAAISFHRHSVRDSAGAEGYVLQEGTNRLYCQLIWFETKSGALPSMPIFCLVFLSKTDQLALIPAEPAGSGDCAEALRK
jgi:hypothetical protein